MAEKLTYNYLLSGERMENRKVVILVITIFFVISFITNILGPIFPVLIDTYQIGVTLAGFFPFAFFAAYGVMSIPAGILVQRYGEKTLLLGAFVLAFVGAATFALWPTFVVAMIALFLIGTAMAALQVTINPLLRASGGSQHFTFLSVVAQFAFGIAAVLSPLVYSYLVANIEAKRGVGVILAPLVPTQAAWVSMYWLFAVICLLMTAWIWFSKIQKTTRNKDEIIEQNKTWFYFSDKTVLRFFFAIVAYVAIEQGMANSLSLFLQQYHDMDSEVAGAKAVSQFWLMLTIGCAVGLPFLKLFDAQKILMVCCVLAGSCWLKGLFSDSATVTTWLTFAGFFLSIMWSVTVSLGLNSMKEGHGTVAGILCTGIVGGAIISPIIGIITALLGSLQFALCILLLPLGYLFYVAYSAQPLVKNHTVCTSQWFKRFTEKRS